MLLGELALQRLADRWFWREYRQASIAPGTKDGRSWPWLHTAWWRRCWNGSACSSSLRTSPFHPSRLGRSLTARQPDWKDHSQPDCRLDTSYRDHGNQGGTIFNIYIWVSLHSWDILCKDNSTGLLILISFTPPVHSTFFQERLSSRGQPGCLLASIQLSSLEKSSSSTTALLLFLRSAGPALWNGWWVAFLLAASTARFRAVFLVEGAQMVVESCWIEAADVVSELEEAEAAVAVRSGRRSLVHNIDSEASLFPILSHFVRISHQGAVHENCCYSAGSASPAAGSEERTFPKPWWRWGSSINVESCARGILFRKKRLEILD